MEKVKTKRLSALLRNAARKVALFDADPELSPTQRVEDEIVKFVYLPI
jgi:hypothetical protein